MSRESVRDFSTAIFGENSKLGPWYFTKRKSITTDVLEKLCKHFDVNPDVFFDFCDGININSVISDNKVGNININYDIKYLQTTIDHLNKVIRDKEEQIDFLKNQNKAYWEFISSFSTKNDAKLGQNSDK